MASTNALINARWHLWSQCLSQFRHVEQISLAGGGRRAIERHVFSLKKLTVRNRIKLLLDPSESFFELSRCAGYDLPDVGTIPAAGFVTGIGRIGSHECLILGQDSTVKAGATYPISLKKAMRANKIAVDNSLPMVSLVDSAGAFLPLQSEIFPDAHHGGRTFYNQARHCAPQIAVVLGHCTAGGAYTPMMTDQAIIVERIGAVFLGGPPLVKAALGTIISAEELGGAKLHTLKSGCTDYRTTNENEAMSLVRDAFIKALPAKSSAVASQYSEPIRPLDDVESLFSDQHVGFDARKVAEGLYDGGSFHEFRPEYGQGIVTNYGTIMSQPVATVITTGTHALVSDPDSLTKFAHFVQICSSRQLPLLFVINSSPDQVTPSSSDAKSIALAAAARVMSVIATAPVARLSLIIGDHRVDDVYFSSGLQPDFILTWPSAKFFTKFTDASVETDEPAEKNAEENGEQENLLNYDAVYGSARIWDDGIILPSETRAKLGRLLSIIASRKERQSLYSQMFWPQPALRHVANMGSLLK